MPKRTIKALFFSYTGMERDIMGEEVPVILSAYQGEEVELSDADVKRGEALGAFEGSGPVQTRPFTLDGNERHEREARAGTLDPSPSSESSEAVAAVAKTRVDSSAFLASTTNDEHPDPNALSADPGANMEVGPDELVTRKAPEVISAVGEDSERAEDVLAAEKDREGGPRSTVVEALERVIARGEDRSTGGEPGTKRDED